MLVLLFGDRRRAGENQKWFNEFRGLDSDESQIYPDAAAAGKDDDHYHKNAYSCPYEFFLVLYPAMISAQQIAESAGNYRGYAGYEMFDVEMYFAKA